jgi:hypothetical protein
MMTGQRHVAPRVMIASTHAKTNMRVRPSQTSSHLIAPQTGEGQSLLAVGTHKALLRLSDAWTSYDHDRVGQQLGYPRCCREFYQKVMIDENMLDPTWQIACSVRGRGEYRNVEVNCSPISNTLWRWADIAATFHLPCRYDCPDTVRLGEQLVALGCRSGYSDEMEWLIEILSWPVEWSALHGIAEIKTPIFRMITDSDATPHKYTVRIKGDKYPPEGAIGKSFPYSESILCSSSDYLRQRRSKFRT